MLLNKSRDLVRVLDKGLARLRTRAGEIIAGREWDADNGKSVVEVEGWVKIVARERGKLVGKRSGHNIWTNTGREYLAMVISLQTPGVTFRDDHVGYIGVGTGSQVEDAGVLSLITPIVTSGSTFLTALDIPPDFPLTPSRTTVRYHRVYTETEISTTSTQVNVSEVGLFTDGSPTAVPAYTPGTRDVTLANAAAQAPIAYKSFDPLGKTQSIQLEVFWEVRF